ARRSVVVDSERRTPCPAGESALVARPPPRPPDRVRGRLAPAARRREVVAPAGVGSEARAPWPAVAAGGEGRGAGAGRGGARVWRGGGGGRGGSGRRPRRKRSPRRAAIVARRSAAVGATASAAARSRARWAPPAIRIISAWPAPSWWA